jgi:phenylalanyl-tRNA synthetase beta chain
LLNGQAIGWIGKLHPKFQQQYGLAKSTYLFELAAEALLLSHVPAYQEVSKFLPVRRDIAIVVDANVHVQSHRRRCHERTNSAVATNTIV